MVCNRDYRGRGMAQNPSYAFHNVSRLYVSSVAPQLILLSLENHALSQRCPLDEASSLRADGARGFNCRSPAGEKRMRTAWMMVPFISIPDAKFCGQERTRLCAQTSID